MTFTETLTNNVNPSFTTTTTSQFYFFKRLLSVKSELLHCIGGPHVCDKCMKKEEKNNNVSAMSFQKLYGVVRMHVFSLVFLLMDSFVRAHSSVTVGVFWTGVL